MSGNLQSFHLIYRRQADGDGGMRFEYIKRTTGPFSTLCRLRVDRRTSDEAFREEDGKMDGLVKFFFFSRGLFRMGDERMNINRNFNDYEIFG